MTNQMRFRAVMLIVMLVGWTTPLTAELSERWQPMNQPVEPFRMIGNVYYVGASSVTSFLITTPDGHILIDGGFEETVPLIRRGVEQLGFQFEDIRILLNSHAHFDHAGGLAAIQAATGARVVASSLETPALERGGLGDDLLGDEAPFPAVVVDQQLADGESIAWGGMVLTARVTAGHTRGCTSWDFDVNEGGQAYRVVSICSLSVLDGMVFEGTAPEGAALEDEALDGTPSDDAARVVKPTYPTIADDFRASFAALEAIPADVFLAAHAGFFGLEAKRERRATDGGLNPFVDPEGYRAYIARARVRFERMLADERAARDTTTAARAESPTHGASPSLRH